MPELPEVERTRRKLEGVALQQTVASITTIEDTIVYQGVTHTAFADAMRGAAFAACHRYGKWMYSEMRLASPSATHRTYFFLHLGMTGSLRIKGLDNTEYRSAKIKYDPESEVWPPKYARFDLTLDDGTQMAFCDPRRLGRVMLVTVASEEDLFQVAPLAGLGFDPALRMPPADEFATAVRARKTAIKALLLDQAFAAGVGNWIADEVCYQARVHPARRTNTLSDAELAALHAALDMVIREACLLNGEYDSYPAGWLFHVRWGKAAHKKILSPDGDPVEFVTVGGRTSAFVPKLQKLRPATPDQDAAAADDENAMAIDEDNVLKTPGRRRRQQHAAQEAESELSSLEDSDEEETPSTRRRRQRQQRIDQLRRDGAKRKDPAERSESPSASPPRKRSRT
ncbi:hypothetical protein H9P43_000477 [Blastocladiella emersonii ATCC 22665]|nr:hypothetical protein H9P43_000477 [Blastocladiella emersonii ATCC 22665]